MSQTTQPLENVNAPSSLSETERHRLLGSARRRHVLAVLDGCEGSMVLTDLAAAVIERERGDQRDVDHVATALHHNHLPKLADAGVIAYDQSANRITP